MNVLSSAGLLLRSRMDRAGHRKQASETSVAAEEGDREHGRGRASRGRHHRQRSLARGMPAAPRLKLLQVAVAGTDRVETAARRVGHGVQRLRHEMAMAEYAVMAMLVWSHRLLRDRGRLSRRLVARQRRHERAAAPRNRVDGRDRRARQVGRRQPSAPPRSVAMCWAPTGTSASRRPGRPGVPLAELDRMLPLCECRGAMRRLAPETRGLMDARRFALMSATAFLSMSAVVRLPMRMRCSRRFARRNDRRRGAPILWRYPTPEEPISGRHAPVPRLGPM